MYSLVFLFVLAVPISVLILQTTRIVLAQSWGSSLEPATIQHAIALDPANPDLHFALGNIMLLNAQPDAQGAAEQNFREAVSMNPYSAAYWSGLGKTCYSSGNQPCADAAFRRAQQLAPTRPEVAWEAAINNVVSSQPKAAVEQLRTFLRLHPDGLEQTFQLLMRGFNDPNIVWRDLLGSSSNVTSKLQFLEYLAANNDFEPAAAYWAQLTADKSVVPIAAVSPYVDRLLAGGRYREAGRVWRYAVDQNDLDSQAVTGERNLVFNGGFEQDPLSTGLDWHFWQQPYLNLDFADRTAHSGVRAFRADFTVPQNSEYELAYQLVPVVPRQTYELRAYVRSQAITSDSGPRLRVLDPKCNVCLDAATQGTSGTTDWHQVATEFTTGPTTEMVRLSIWRPRGRSYPMEIGGQVWFDDVSIRPVSAATAGQER
jgi:tetratricopeptide (TPR) repeat protein